MRPGWFRIHLSTALILVFAASGFIALNFLPSPPGTKYFGLRESSDGPAVQVISSGASPDSMAKFRVLWSFGFPEIICKKIYEVEARNDASPKEVLANVPVRAGEFGGVDQDALFTNGLDLALLLLFVTICCELIIHSRRSKQERQS